MNLKVLLIAASVFGVIGTAVSLYPNVRRSQISAEYMNCIDKGSSWLNGESHRFQTKGANLLLGGCSVPYEDALMEEFRTLDQSKLPMKIW